MAHNVGFDRNVLASCCERYDIDLPTLKYQCTVQLARKQLGIYPTNSRLFAADSISSSNITMRCLMPSRVQRSR